MEPAEYETMYLVEETHWWYRALRRLILEMLDAKIPNWRSQTILDAGCGTGRILQALGNAGKNVGIDIAPEAIGFCRQRGLTNVQQADICALPFEDGTFDVVICSSVLYHEWVRDIERATRELRRVLRPGGSLLINVPAYRFLYSAHDKAVMTARRFTRPELRRLLLENDFVIGRLTYWTTLLFPVAVIARTFGGSKTGRDFQTSSNSLTGRLFGGIMEAELWLLKHVSLPFGVALFAVAEKRP